jgi:hypothetical protein
MPLLSFSFVFGPPLGGQRGAGLIKAASASRCAAEAGRLRPAGGRGVLNRDGGERSWPRTLLQSPWGRMGCPMSRHRRWLKQEAARWAAHGGITPDGPERSLRKPRSGWSASTRRTLPGLPHTPLTVGVVVRVAIFVG